MFLSNLAIKRPVFATVLVLALLTLGLFSYRRLAIELMPDVELPILTITTEFPGASPEAVERELTRKIEEAVNPIAGVRHVYSTSREGLSSVMVEFHLQVRINEASQEVRAKINAVRRELPEQIKEPVIQKMDFGAMPVVALAVRSPTLTARDLTTVVDRKVKRRLESIPGVGKVRLVGASRREVNVLVDPARIDAMGLGVDEVIAGLAAENVNTPLGRLNREGTEMPLRISGKPALVPGFEAMVIGHRGDHPVTLGEVATVVDGIEEQRSLALVNGVPAVALEVLKQSKSNTVGVVEAVKHEVGRLAPELPPGTEIDLVRDSSVMIRESVSDVQTTMIVGGFLTILIVFCFLNSWRSTVITGVTLPISVISSFISMYFFGMTLNVMTLMALSLAIGLLIDDAIVVRENIVRHLEHGEDHMAAARNGTAEIGLAVLSTSLSIMAVFVPVAFMKGVVGRFFFQFGITVAFAVLVSLFVSFTLDPMLSSRWVDPDVERKGKRHVVARLLDRFNTWFDRTADRYKALIGWALDRRKLVLGVASGAFLVGLGLFALLESEFFPAFDRAEFMVRFKTAPDASIEETKGRLGVVLGELKSLPEIERTYATIAAGDADTVRNAAVFVKLREKSERRRDQYAVMRDVRARLEGIPGLIPSVEEDADSFQKPFMVLVRGEEIPKLKEYAAALKKSLYGVGGIVDLEATLEQDLPEYRLTVVRERARDAGLGTDAVVSTVGALVGGQIVSTYEDEAGEAVNVRVRLPEGLREDVRQVGTLRLAVAGPGTATLVPLADLVRVERTVSPSEISRQDLSRQVVLSANLDRLPLGTAAEAALREAARIPMSPGYRVVMSGDTEIMAESFGYLGEALVLAVVFVYLILAAQFESFIDPLAIMLSLPLSIVGMAGMLILTRDTVSIMSLIGLILLMGLVTKNAILLVDYTKVLRRRGMERREALIMAGRTRLRPILMTTLAMIFGMLPLALAIGQGAEMRAPMARAVIGGLVTSTLLTLIVVPVVYTLLDDVAGWLHGRWAKANAVAADAATRRTGISSAARSAVLLALLLPSPAARAEAPPVPITLEEAVRLVQERNRDVQKARSYQDWVRGKFVEERAAALPRFELLGGGVRSWDETYRVIFGDFYPPAQSLATTDVNLTQSLFTWGQVAAAIRAAKGGMAAAEDQLDSSRQTAVRDVTAAFYDVLLARRIEGIARENLAQRERHLTQARSRQRLGTATDYDVLAAEVALENARPAVIRSVNLILSARERLRFVLADERPGLDAAGTLETDVTDPPPYEEVLETAIEGRPDLMALRHRVGVYREFVKIQSAGDKPRLDLRAGAGWKWLDADGLSGSGKTWNAGLYLSFPFFDGLATKGRVIEAKSDLRSGEIDLAKAEDGVRLEVRNAVDAVRESALIVRALAGTVAQARKLLQMAEKGFEFGVKTRLEVDDAQLAVVQAEGNLATATRDHLVAWVTLRYVQGLL